MEKPASTEPRKVKIIFETDERSLLGAGCAETLWAEAIAGPREDLFQLLNSPWSTMGISFLDVVRAAPTEHKGMYNFVEVIQRSGHSTYMILMVPKDPRARALWNWLQGLGCRYESAIEHLEIGVRELLSVDVPPEADLSVVREILERGEQDGVWMYQEGYVFDQKGPPQ